MRAIVVFVGFCFGAGVGFVVGFIGGPRWEMGMIFVGVCGAPVTGLVGALAATPWRFGGHAAVGIALVGAIVFGVVGRHNPAWVVAHGVGALIVGSAGAFAAARFFRSKFLELPR